MARAGRRRHHRLACCRGRHDRLAGGAGAGPGSRGAATRWRPQGGGTTGALLRRGALMALAIQTPSPLDPEGRGARILGQEITFQLIAGSAVLLLVLGILLAIVLRRRAATQERPPQLDDETGRRWIWLGGVALPLVVLTALVAFGARSLLALGNEDDP